MNPTSTDRPTFSVCGDLPTGTVVLEASAGTGKTFTIAALATRYVAEGVADLGELLIVTFGRAATAELRERVRERLVSAERALRDPVGARAAEDDVVRHLAAVGDAELAERRARLTRALADFDAATIATTHGFCQQMLAGLGIGGDADADAVLVPDIADLVDEVVDDLYLQGYAAAELPMLGISEARDVAHRAVADPHARLEPADADPRTPAGHRYAFARRACDEVLRRKHRRRIVDYDDLLLQLQQALTHPQDGPAAVERVRSMFRIVLVDEFQDTDPVQWQILLTAFHGARTLVLIGDPKQAIYAFRGADVVTYLDATRTAGSQATLGRNWRSDPDLLAALHHVFGGAALGHDEIVVHQVDAAHQGRRLRGGAPVRLRVAPRGVLGSARGRHAPVGEIRQVLARDVAADIVTQLTGSVRLVDTGVERGLQPADLAVIVPSNAEAALVLQALADAAVPAVQSGFASVFSTPSATHWLTLLQALEQPGRPQRVGAAALTPFLGWEPERLALASDEDREALGGRVRFWAHVLGAQGVAGLVEVVSAAGLAERLLGTTTGERTMTDLRHIGQALHGTATAQGLGVTGLADWLRRRMDEAAKDYAEERSRRLESDAAAVQVVTVHASKGLEFPVVYVPFGWGRHEFTQPETLRLHDEAGLRVLDVGGRSGPGHAGRLAAHLAEERGEVLRHLYVALTRAQSQVVLWWAPSNTTATGPLTRLLLAGSMPGLTPPDAVSVPADAEVLRRLEALSVRSGGTIAVEAVAPVVDLHWSPRAEPVGPLAAAAFDRRLDTGWRRTSYSGLTAGTHDGHRTAVASEPEPTGADDEAEVVLGTTAPAHGSAAVPSPMADLPGGTGFGTLVHRVLEVLDTGAADLDAELLQRCREATTSRLAGIDAAQLAHALAPSLATSLGPLAPGVTLARIAPRDRLSEMDFELPLAGGDSSGGREAATLADVADVLRRHLSVDDPLAGYADLLDVPALADQLLRGYLAGSVDAVVRVRGDGRPSPGDGPARRGAPRRRPAAGDEPVRYVVVDYKTNRLAPPDQPLTAWHYRPQALAEAMAQAHYPLQLLLYLVALHRFLRWRQPGYDPDVHLGGGLYLFLRGMCGPDTPVVDGSPCGVFGWRPPTAVVTELSALLDSGSGPRRRGSSGVTS